MNDTITQNRLSLRLDAYMHTYQGNAAKKETLSRTEWEIVWQAAETARVNNTLTPELVDDVRRALHKLSA